MERIKKALDKARQERQIRQGGSHPAPSPTVQPVRTAEPEYDQTETITLDEAVLRKNHIVSGMGQNTFTDSYNLLRTQVLQRFKENNWNVLGITSPGTGEGKTLTAINLAISIAREVDYTVMLVDANLRHPWMMEYFGLESREGLSDYLTGNAPIADLLVKSGRIEHLVVLPGGQPLTNSAEMLNSPKMAELVTNMKSRYHSRIIIFDLPPVLSSADALAFSPYVDAVLLVVEEGTTQKQDIKHAVELLSGTNILGTVLNKAEIRGS